MASRKEIKTIRAVTEEAKAKGRLLVVVNTKQFHVVVSVKETTTLGAIRKTVLKRINVPVDDTMMWWGNLLIDDSVTALQVTQENGGKIPPMKIYKLKELAEGN